MKRKICIIIGVVLLFIYFKLFFVYINSVADTQDFYITRKILMSTPINDFERQGLNMASQKEVPEVELVAHFNPNDIREASNLTAQQIEMMLKDGLSGLGEHFVSAEKEYGVNAAFLASLAALESAWGTSTFATERNNLFGFTAYDNNLNATSYFDSHQSCIMHVAEYLSIHYLTEGGKYHNGYSVKSINELYASDPHWNTKITHIASRGIRRIRTEE